MIEQWQPVLPRGGAGFFIGRKTTRTWRTSDVVD